MTSYIIKIKGKWELFYEIIGTITTVIGVFLISEGYYVEGFLINAFSDIVWATRIKSGFIYNIDNITM